MVHLVVKIPPNHVKIIKQPSVRRKAGPVRNAGRTARLFERIAQPIRHTSRSTGPADRLAHGPTHYKFHEVYY
ncbi:hypothetical protein Hanom_Chr13g01207631 [Helianthus anomalus]